MLISVTQSASKLKKIAEVSIHSFFTVSKLYFEVLLGFEIEIVRLAELLLNCNNWGECMNVATWLKVWLTDQPIGIEKGKRWQSRHSKTITYCTNVYSYTSNHNTGKKTLKPYSSGCDSKLKKITNRVQVGLARYQNKLCTRDNEVGLYHISKFIE